MSTEISPYIQNAIEIFMSDIPKEKIECKITKIFPVKLY